ncbi:50S ribosomal protein L28 [bacterium]|nr:50S ribosomal protein L28 [bacterium]
MGKVCEICGKKTSTGNKVSHSNRKSRRTWKPNIQRMLTEIKGVRRRINICTSCIKTGKVKRPSAPQQSTEPEE